MSLLLMLQDEYAKGYGAVLDSGTTFTYLPTAAFNAFLELLNEALQGKGVHRSSGADPEVWLAAGVCCARFCFHDLRLCGLYSCHFNNSNWPSSDAPSFMARASTQCVLGYVTAGEVLHRSSGAAMDMLGLRTCATCGSTAALVSRVY
jgi:hypothetical protein